MTDTKMTDTKRRLDLRIDADLARFANDVAYYEHTTISEIVERGLRRIYEESGSTPETTIIHEALRVQRP